MHGVELTGRQHLVEVGLDAARHHPVAQVAGQESVHEHGLRVALEGPAHRRVLDVGRDLGHGRGLVHMAVAVDDRDLVETAPLHLLARVGEEGEMAVGDDCRAALRH